MKKIVLFLFVLILPLSGFTMCKSNPSGEVDMSPRLIQTSSDMTSAEMIEQVRSAVVGIKATSYAGTAIGSGVAVAEDGYILTNNHVIQGAKNVVLYLADKSEANAEIVYTQPSLDIAILKTDINLPFLDIAYMKDIQVGEDVIAIGTPISLSFQHTVTKGIVSALGRVLEVGNDNGTVTYMQNLIQHDASINAGNSGGPLINSKGKLIGINTLKVQDAEGLGFAIPIDTAKIIVSKVSKTGSFEPAYIGVLGYDAEIAKINHETTQNSGVYVQDVNIYSRANKGVEIGDVIVAVNDIKIKNNLDLQNILYSLSPNDKITLEIIRNNQTIFVII